MGAQMQLSSQNECWLQGFLQSRSYTETIHLILWHFVLLRKHCGLDLISFVVRVRILYSLWLCCSVSSFFFPPRCCSGNNGHGPKSYQVGLILSIDTCDNYFIKAVEAVHTLGTPVALTEERKMHVVCVSPSATHCFHVFFILSVNYRINSNWQLHLFTTAAASTRDNVRSHKRKCGNPFAGHSHFNNNRWHAPLFSYLLIKSSSFEPSLSSRSAHDVTVYPWVRPHEIGCVCNVWLVVNTIVLWQIKPNPEAIINKGPLLLFARNNAIIIMGFF